MGVAISCGTPIVQASASSLRLVSCFEVFPEVRLNRLAKLLHIVRILTPQGAIPSAFIAQKHNLIPRAGANGARPLQIEEQHQIHRGFQGTNIPPGHPPSLLFIPGKAGIDHAQLRIDQLAQIEASFCPSSRVPACCQVCAQVTVRRS
mgnify:CR=1 FL=1